MLKKSRFVRLRDEGGGFCRVRHCLPDGTDDDLLSDGCIRIATLNDLNAEWTGGVFDETGAHFYVSVQHTVTGKGVVLAHHRLEVATALEEVLLRRRRPRR